MIRDKLRLYKQRVKAFRAESGSIAYHEATAKIRAYNGDTFGAVAHSLTAALKRFKERMSETVIPAFSEFAEAICDLDSQLDEPILDV